MIYSDDLPSTRDIERLLEIPGISKRVFLFLKRIEAEEKAAIAAFEASQNIFKNTALSNIKKRGNPGDNTFWFELYQKEGGLWRLYKIEPTPVHCDESKILPLDIIQDMSQSYCDPGDIFDWQRISQITRCSYDICFLHPSRYSICGAVCPDFKNLAVRDDARDEKEHKPIAYLTLISYMKKYPAYENHVFSEFFYKAKPILDGRLQEIDESDFE